MAAKQTQTPRAAYKYLFLFLLFSSLLFTSLCFFRFFRLAWVFSVFIKRMGFQKPNGFFRFFQRSGKRIIVILRRCLLRWSAALFAVLSVCRALAFISLATVKHVVPARGPEIKQRVARLEVRLVARLLEQEHSGDDSPDLFIG